MKGYLYTVEVLIAISIVFIPIVLIFSSTPAKPSLELSLIKAQGFDALEYLNTKGDLRELAMNNNETGIESELRGILPKNMRFETEICYKECPSTNVPSNVTIIAIDYYLSGYKDSYRPEKIRLWMWREF